MIFYMLYIKYRKVGRIAARLTGWSNLVTSTFDNNKYII